MQTKVGSHTQKKYNNKLVKILYMSEIVFSFAALYSSLKEVIRTFNRNQSL
jgi:hypothetical protein